jgi:regulatory protein
VTEPGSHNLDDSEAAEAAPPSNPADVRLAAMNLLARREHSRWELLRKLRRRFPDESVLSTELQRLTDENLQSDERYAQGYAWQRAGRGYGPLRLRQEMRERGLSDSEIAGAFDNDDFDWYTLATEAYRKKFGAQGPVDIKEKARRIRFMQYRGFSPEHYQHLVND